MQIPSSLSWGGFKMDPWPKGCGFGPDYGSIWNRFGSASAHLGGAVAGQGRCMGRRTSEKRHPKIYAKIHAEKVTKSMPNGSQNDTKWMPKSTKFHAFSKKAKMHETIVFTIENVTPGT